MAGAVVWAVASSAVGVSGVRGRAVGVRAARSWEEGAGDTFPEAALPLCVQRAAEVLGRTWDGDREQRGRTQDGDREQWGRTWDGDRGQQRRTQDRGQQGRTRDGPGAGLSAGGQPRPPMQRLWGWL